MTKKSDDDSTYDIKAKIVSINQQGGQTAETIYNVGSQRRTLRNVNIQPLLDQLSEFSGTKVIIASLGTDSETLRFAKELKILLNQAGWAAKGGLILMSGGGGPTGVILQSPEDDLPQSLVVLGRCLKSVGIEASGICKCMISGIQILVGAN